MKHGPDPLLVLVAGCEGPHEHMEWLRENDYDSQGLSVWAGLHIKFYLRGPY